MFYKQIAHFDKETLDVSIYKVPTRLTREQIEQFLEHKNHKKENSIWYEVNNLKVDKKMNKLQFMKMFPSEEQLKLIKKIHLYFKAYESRQQNYVQMKAIACKILYNKGLMHEHIRDIMGYKNHASIVHLTTHRPDLNDFVFEQENFWRLIDEELYPVWTNKNRDKIVKWVKLSEVNKY